MSTTIRIHSLNMGMARAYLVENQNALLLVDAGSPGSEKRVLNAMHKLGRNDLNLIFITHAHLDHYGSAGALRRLTGARIAVHQQDAEPMQQGETPLGEVRGRGKLVERLLPLMKPFLHLEPTPPDLIFDDGGDLSAYGFPASVLHIPGHTSGSSCLLLGGRHAFAGDLVSTTGVPHTQRYYAHDWRQLSDSVKRLQALRPDKIYPGHGRRPLERDEFLAL
jgi:glyoxylase-like metal-dependent hydrolase (beta-lactamase superfamily II)